MAKIYFLCILGWLQHNYTGHLMLRPVACWLSQKILKHNRTVGGLRGEIWNIFPLKPTVWCKLLIQPLVSNTFQSQFNFFNYIRHMIDTETHTGYIDPPPQFSQTSVFLVGNWSQRRTFTLNLEQVGSFSSHIADHILAERHRHLSVSPRQKFCSSKPQPEYKNTMSTNL